MAKNSNSISVEINPDDLGVASRHHFLMATDQDYRDRALTPPGGKAPGEGDKPADKVSGDAPVPAAIPSPA